MTDDFETSALSKLNKGNWAEVYAALKVSVDGYLNVARPDQLPETIRNFFKNGAGVDGVFQVPVNYIGTYARDKSVSPKSPLSKRTRVEGAQLISELFSDIQKDSKATPRLPSDAALQLAYLTGLPLGHTPSGSSKGDIWMDYSNVLGIAESGLRPFTVKSWIGADPSLVNISGDTLIKYSLLRHVTPPAPLTCGEALLWLQEHHASQYRFEGFQSATYSESLSEIHPGLLPSLAYANLCRNLNPGLNTFSAVEDLLKMGGAFPNFTVSAHRQCGSFAPLPRPPVFRELVKRFLLESLLTLKPSIPRAPAGALKGGLLLVSKSGDLLAIPNAIEYLDDIAEFLYLHSKLDVNPGNMKGKRSHATELVSTASDQSSYTAGLLIRLASTR